MASAQVLPNSRKQEHLEAGKRRLEEFRKKKAAEKTKKAASATSVPASTADNNEKCLSDKEIVRGADSDGAGASSVGATTVNQLSAVETTSDGNSLIFLPSNKLGSDIDVNAQSGSSLYGIDAFGSNASHTNGIEPAYKIYEGLGSREDFSYSNKEENDLKGGFGLSRASSGFSSDHLPKQGVHGNDGKSSSFSFPGKEESLPRESSGSLKNIMSATTNIFMDQHVNAFSLSSGSSMAPEKVGLAKDNSSYFSEDYTSRSTSTTGHIAKSTSDMLNRSHFDGTLDFQKRNLSSAFSGFPSMEGVASLIPDHSSTGFSSTFSSSPNHLPLNSSNAETQPRRSRPSFLDSMKVPRGSPVLPHKSTLSEESVNSSKFNGSDIIESSATSRYSSDSHMAPLSKPTPDLYNFPAVTPSTSVYNNFQSQRSNFNEPNMESKRDFLQPKPNEDFSALEQHIEDLTQEKFSLQRAIEASRTLAEFLAAENTSLTDSYNQQRNAVNQLKEDMEKLQAEINTQLVELEAMKSVYANAQLECNAADERAKLLASEVIGLEEKALRLRSSELKLERQLENSHAEISTYKKKVASLEKERQDLQSTIGALQEEKKMLQSKVRKASSYGNSIDMNLMGIKRKEMSTSTEDLDMNTEQVVDTRLLDGSEDSSFSLPDGAQLNLVAASAFIPTDHMRVIANINTLISELAFEKEELLKALESEKADNGKMKVLNKELSRKIETQTQRLELLTAQSMGPENLTARLRDNPMVIENAPFADEGDEVVERVLGWIMKLFPGGPSRRRPSKHL